MKAENKKYRRGNNVRSKLIRVWNKNASELEEIAKKNNLSIAQALDMAMRKIKRKKMEIKF